MTVRLSALVEHIARVREEASEEMARLITEHWIRVMCDHRGSGIVSRDGNTTRLELLPITAELVLRIRIWQQEYEQYDFEERTGDEDFAPVLASWSADGLAIAIDLKRQLPRWTIIYHDEARRPPIPEEETLERISHGDRSLALTIWYDHFRPWFEYEITPEVVATGRPPDNYPAAYPK